MRKTFITCQRTATEKRCQIHVLFFVFFLFAFLCLIVNHLTVQKIKPKPGSFPFIVTDTHDDGKRELFGTTVADTVPVPHRPIAKFCSRTVLLLKYYIQHPKCRGFLLNICEREASGRSSFRSRAKDQKRLTFIYCSPIQVVVKTETDMFMPWVSELSHYYLYFIEDFGKHGAGEYTSVKKRKYRTLQRCETCCCWQFCRSEVRLSLVRRRRMRYIRLCHKAKFRRVRQQFKAEEASVSCSVTRAVCDICGTSGRWCTQHRR